MIYCYPVINGKKERHWFYSSWEEVPFRVFLKWQPLSFKLDDLNIEYSKKANEIEDLAEQIGMNAYSGGSELDVEGMESKIDVLGQELEDIKDTIDILEAEAITFFSSIPIDAAMMFDASRTIEEITDNHLQAYRVRLYSLAITPLPTEVLSSFIFQSETDDDIEVMEKEYKSYTLLQKSLPKGRRLKKQIKKAKSTKYQIQNLWEQTTIANKELQEMAVNIMKQVDDGDFSGLLFLIALLTTEGQEDQQALDAAKGKKGKQFIESYRKEFIEVFRKRQDIFQNSKAGLSTATVWRIKNFFLNS